MPGALRMHVRSLAKSLVMRSLARRWHPRSPAGHGWWPRPETRDPWTVKDALVHIVYWKSHTARVIRGEKRPPEMRGLDVPSLNHLIWQQWRERSPDEVLAWHREVQADILATLAARPEEWFSRRPHSSEWPADFDGHSAGHRLKDIQRALGYVQHR
jgi:hypothetical protein